MRIAVPQDHTEWAKDQPTHLYTPDELCEALCGFVLGRVPGGPPRFCTECLAIARHDGYTILARSDPCAVPHGGSW